MFLLSSAGVDSTPFIAPSHCPISRFYLPATCGLEKRGIATLPSNRPFILLTGSWYTRLDSGRVLQVNLRGAYSERCHPRFSLGGHFLVFIAAFVFISDTHICWTCFVLDARDFK